jgi:uncharacterized damage-inducible protein DinB
MIRPGTDEYAPYYGNYISQVPEGADPIALLGTQAIAIPTVLATVPRDRESYRYAPEKWTVKDVIGHVADAERIFAYRMLRIARADPAPLSSFDENLYVQNAGFAARPLADVTADWVAVRGATLTLARALEAPWWERRGTASGKPVSARALLFIIVGHAAHHMRILKERYGVG